MAGKTKDNDGAKKQLLLRLSPSLWNEINQWAQDEFRSINGQIEYLLTQAVRQRKKKENLKDKSGETEELSEKKI